MTPAEVLRNRARAVGVEMTVDQAEGTVNAMRAQGFKIVARDCGESADVVMEFTTLADGSRDAKLAHHDPKVIWAKIYDQMA